MTVPCGVATLICSPIPGKGDYPIFYYHWAGKSILLGLRKGDHGAGMWSVPGGYIEPGEDPKIAAERGVFEETGLIVTVGIFEPVPFNNTLVDGRPWVTLFFIAWLGGEGSPQVMEPDKCERWEWFKGKQLPQPLFGPFAAFVHECTA